MVIMNYLYSTMVPPVDNCLWTYLVKTELVRYGKGFIFEKEF